MPVSLYLYNDLCIYLFYSFHQVPVEIRLFIMRGEETASDAPAAEICSYTRKLIHIVPGGFIHRRVVLLQFGVRDGGDKELHFAQVAGIVRIQVQENGEAASLGGEEERHHTRIGGEPLTHKFHLFIFQVVYANGDDGVVAKQGVRLPHVAVVARQSKKGEPPPCLLHGVAVSAAADIGDYGTQVRFSRHGGEATVGGDN